MSYKIGITGGIASGKSLVLGILKELGIPVISADDIVKDLQKDPYYLEKIRVIFGDKVFEGENLNRKKLADIIFSDESARLKLNSIFHPPVLKEIRKKMEELKEKPIIAVEVPLLFEVGIEDWFDEIWVVYVPLEVQIQRIMNRDKVSREEAIKRIKSQISLEEKIKTAHFVVYNNKDKEYTKRQVIDRILYLQGMLYNKNLE
jgi:dephospho-CoA kinase